MRIKWNTFFIFIIVEQWELGGGGGGEEGVGWGGGEGGGGGGGGEIQNKGNTISFLPESFFNVILSKV